MAEIKHSGVMLPISSDLLGDSYDLRVNERIAEYFTYGQPRTHRNPMPEFVFFPRLQAVLDRVGRLRGRCSDAVYAFRYGIPDESDW